MTKDVITWDELVEIEPRLGALYEQISKVKDDKNAKSFCANNHWYGYHGCRSFKAEMAALVGWESRYKNPRLRSMEAYDVAFRKLYYALPDCRNCGCF